MKLSTIATFIIGSLLAICLAFILGKCSGEAKIIYVPQEPDIVYVDSSGTNKIQIDTVFIDRVKAKIVYMDKPDSLSNDDTSDVIENVPLYATMDSVFYVPVKITQLDSSNNVEKISIESLRMSLNATYFFPDSTFSFEISHNGFEIKHYNKTIIKHTEQKPYHWTRSDWFLYPLATLIAIAFFLLGNQTAK